MSRNSIASPTLDEPRLRALAQAKLLDRPLSEGEADGCPSDFDLNPEAGPVDTAAATPAAVLIPIVAGAELKVVLTERTAHLPAHAGQIAFPGGKFAPGDTGPAATALRETFEEIGLTTDFVEPLGYIEPYRTGTGFLVTPVVGLVRTGYQLKPDPSEVAAIFEVPLAFLLDDRNHRIDSRLWRGAERRFYAMPYEGRYIWGATAGIIRTLHRRLFTE